MNILVGIEIACAIGAIVLFPSLYLLFSVFKAHRKSVITEDTVITEKTLA